jgi:hypothetical protein
MLTVEIQRNYCSDGNAEGCQVHATAVVEGPWSLSIGAEEKRTERDGAGGQERTRRSTNVMTPER